MRNKSTVMAFCGLQILVFHLWIMVTNGNVIELFLKNTAYIGVDIFFFMSAYSLANREIQEYASFVKNRFFSVYFKFLLFCLVAFFYSNWNVLRLIKIVTGWQFLTKGGGSFLWFVPAIMILYLVFPLFKRLDEYNRALAVTTIFVIWLAGAIAITKVHGINHLAIFWNRLPIYFIGYYLAKSSARKEELFSVMQQLIIGIVLTLIGGTITYFCGFNARLQHPLTGTFYLTAIPFALGVMLLVDLIPSVKFIKLIGASTLEMYAIQMIFGYKLANAVYFKTNNAFFTDFLVIISIIVVSVLLSMLYNVVKKKIMEKSK